MEIKFRRRKFPQVGYKQPPVHTRFQKGKSGNPAGRPKGTLNTAAVLKKAFAQKVTVTVGGRKRKITKLEAAAINYANGSAAGDVKAKADWLRLLIAVDEILKPPAAPEYRWK